MCYERKRGSCNIHWKSTITTFTLCVHNITNKEKAEVFTFSHFLIYLLNRIMPFLFLWENALIEKGVKAIEKIGSTAIHEQ